MPLDRTKIAKTLRLRLQSPIVSKYDNGAERKVKFRTSKEINKFAFSEFFLRRKIRSRALNQLPFYFTIQFQRMTLLHVFELFALALSSVSYRNNLVHVLAQPLHRK